MLLILTGSHHILEVFCYLLLLGFVVEDKILHQRTMERSVDRYTKSLISDRHSPELIGVHVSRVQQWLQKAEGILKQ
jgi:hypothetical protein